MVRDSVMEIMLGIFWACLLQQFVGRGSRVVREWQKSPGSDGASPYHPFDIRRRVSALSRALRARLRSCCPPGTKCAPEF